jgi:hypothetical protein
MIKAWADAALAGEVAVHLVEPPFLFHDPFCHEALVRLRALERVVESAGRCPLAGAQGAQGGDGMTELLVGPHGAKGTAPKADGLREIRDFTRDAERLVMIDPYAYGGEGAEKATSYVDELAKAARIDSSSLKALHIIYSSKHGQTKAIIEGIAARAACAGVKLTDCDTDTIHDRMWIADRARGLVVGTSFGGIGNRAAFLLDLPELDLKHVLEFIDSNDLMKGTARQPKQTAVRKRKQRA